MEVRPRELVAPFLALKLPLIIMGEGMGMGLEQSKPMRENKDRLKNVRGTYTQTQINQAGERLKVETPALPAAQDSGVQPTSPPPPKAG